MFSKINAQTWSAKTIGYNLSLNALQMYIEIHANQQIYLN